MKTRSLKSSSLDPQGDQLKRGRRFVIVICDFLVVNPFNERSKGIRSNIGYGHALSLALDEEILVIVKRCLEVWRVMADEGFVDSESLQVLLSDGDFDHFLVRSSGYVSKDKHEQMASHAYDRSGAFFLTANRGRPIWVIPGLGGLSDFALTSLPMVFGPRLTGADAGVGDSLESEEASSPSMTGGLA